MTLSLPVGHTRMCGSCWCYIILHMEREGERLSLFGWTGSIQQLQRRAVMSAHSVWKYIPPRRHNCSEIVFFPPSLPKPSICHHKVSRNKKIHAALNSKKVCTYVRSLSVRIYMRLWMKEGSQSSFKSRVERFRDEVWSDRFGSFFLSQSGPAAETIASLSGSPASPVKSPMTRWLTKESLPESGDSSTCEFLGAFRNPDPPFFYIPLSLIFNVGG